MFTDMMGMFQKGSLAGKIGLGIVVDNNDPTKNQRVKYRMATLHEGRKDNELVWAIPLGWSAQGNTPGGVGSISIPPVGAKILIFFPEDDEHDSYYFGDFHDQSTQIADLLEDYPNAYGHVDASGNLFLVNTLQNTVRFIHRSGTYIKIAANGAVEIAAADSLKIYSSTTLSLRSAVAINIDAPIINVDTGAASTLTPTARTPPTPQSFSNKVDY